MNDRRNELKPVAMNESDIKFVEAFITNHKPTLDGLRKVGKELRQGLIDKLLQYGNEKIHADKLRENALFYARLLEQLDNEQFT